MGADCVLGAAQALALVCIFTEAIEGVVIVVLQRKEARLIEGRHLAQTHTVNGRAE